MNGGWGVDAQYIAKGLIQFAEEGLDVALRGAEGLEQAANRATEALGKTAAAVTAGLGRALTTALQAPVRMLDMIADKLRGLSNLISNSGLGQLSRLTSIGGGAGIGAILYGSSRDTTEANQLHMAIERLVQVVGDKLAPYFRMATEAVRQLTIVWQSLGDALQTQITKWALVVTGVSGFIALLPTMLSGVAAVVGAIGTLVAAVTSPWMLLIAGVTAAATAIGILFNYMSGSSETATDNVNKANKSWFETFIEFIYKGIEGWGKFWSAAVSLSQAPLNWIDQKLKDVAKNLAGGIVMLDVLSDPRFAKMTKEQQTAFLASKLDPIAAARERDNKPLINDEAVKKAQEGIGAAVGVAQEAMKIIGDPNKLLEALPNKLKDAMNNINAAGAGNAGFGRGTATFESGDATTARLQLAAANQNPIDIAKAQLVEAQKGNDILQKVADNINVNNVVAED